MNSKNILKLFSSIVICNTAGILGALFTSSNSNWYLSLSKPWFNPPGWLFGPAWTTLYILMGISLYWIWQKGLDRKDVKIALSIFGLQLFLNAIWSFLFFGLESAFLGLIGIVPMWIFILLTIERFYRISKKAAYILIPYIIWVSFALILNYTIWVIN